GTSVDGAVAGHDTIAVRSVVLQPESGGTVSGQCVELHERTGIEQCVDPFARGRLTFGVLLLHGSRGPCVDGFVAASLQVGELTRGRVDVEFVRGRWFSGFAGHRHVDSRWTCGGGAWDPWCVVGPHRRRVPCSGRTQWFLFGVKCPKNALGNVCQRVAHTIFNAKKKTENTPPSTFPRSRSL